MGWSASSQRLKTQNSNVSAGNVSGANISGSNASGGSSVNPVLRREQLKRHLTEHCKGISSCQYCPAKYRKGVKLPGKDFAHCCEDYLARLMEEIVGSSIFAQAKEKLNRRLTNRDKLLTDDPSRLAASKEGFISKQIAAEIEAAQEDLSEQISQLREACKRLRVEQVDRLDRTDKFIEN